MFAYSVVETPGATVYTLRDVNICCGPCRDVEEDFVSAHILVDGDTLTAQRVWHLWCGTRERAFVRMRAFVAPVRGRKRGGTKGWAEVPRRRLVVSVLLDSGRLGV
jgi:hypothetical protein